MPWTLRNLSCLLSLFCFVFGCFAVPPQLVDQKMWFVNQSILGVDIEVAVYQMEFDQDLYLSGESFLCAEAEDSCPPSDCTPCDWSSQEPTGCDNVDCCGPAPGDEANEWCESSTTSYYSVSMNGRSPVVTAEAQTTEYFRFFISEEYHCQPIQIFVRPFYGAPVMFLSNTKAFPTPETASAIEGSIPPRWGYAQNSYLLCPNQTPFYGLGTYSIGVHSWLSASYYVEIIAAPQKNPLVPPPGRILCEDVPESELTDAQAGTDSPVYCLQDTETTLIEFDDDFPYAGFVMAVLPIPAGCHQVSFTTSPSGDAFCHSRDNASPLFWDNALLSRWTRGDDRLSFSMCSDTVSYVRCSAQYFSTWPAKLIFSTVAIPFRIPLTPTVDTPAVSVTSQEGLSAVAPAFFGQIGIPCADLVWGCSHWIVPPLADPLIFWPPSSQFEKFDTLGTNVYEEYFVASNAQPLEKTVTGVFVLSNELLEGFPRSQLDEASIVLLFITNELGEAPVLPNNALDLNEKTQASPSVYLPTISLNSFPVLNLADVCDDTNYQSFQNVIDQELGEILNSDTLELMEFHKYILDSLNAGVAGTSCTEAAIRAMKTQVENITLVDQTSCRYELEDPLWNDDPCCNKHLQAVMCCAPFTYFQDQKQFTTADASTCGVSECAETYFDDLAQSLNHVKDLVQGCSSGIKNLRWEVGSAVEDELEKVRFCLNEVGLGDKFEGIDCIADSDCEQWSGKCNHQTKKCVLGTTPEVEDAYLRCYISQITSSLEDYLRLNVLSSSSAPLDSEEFFLGLKSAATVDDCVALEDPLDIFLRSRYVWTVADDCKAFILDLDSENVDVDSVNALCPPEYCLGTSCRASNAQCYFACGPLYVLHESSESECSSSSTVCPVSGIPGGECEGSYCVYCPGGDEEDCQYVEGDQDFCEKTVACELEDDSVIFGLTEAECNEQTGYCSVDCAGESCRSLAGLAGVCLATASSSDTLCEDLNDISGVEAVWFDDTICVISAESESTCAQLATTISEPTSWETCESLPTTSCDGSDAYERYLGCFVDLWHTCTSEEECEASGHCSDRSWTTIVRSSEHPIDVQFGSCFSSGFESSAHRDPHCYREMDHPGIGCRENIVLSPDDCPEFEVIRGVEWWWRTWLTPAMSEIECVNKNDARFGCQLPGVAEHLVWLNEEDCKCHGGLSEYAWEWSNGVWHNGGVSRSLQWRREIDPVEKYQWTPSLSFERLQTWLEANKEQRFFYAMKSEVICENGYVSSSMNSLVCDCFSNESSGECYSQTRNQEVEELVGISAACAEEESSVKGPSSRVSFEMDSINSRCTSVNLSIVSEAWFAVPPPRPSVSFEFEEKPRRGIVLNQKGATVGVLCGDGTVLSFSAWENVDSFSVCLLISENHTDLSKYPIIDFGYSEEAIGTIYPLGLSNVESTTVFASPFWCAKVTVSVIPVDGKKVRLFPIQRVERYENEEEEYTSRKTRALMYTLGVCYCICFVLLFAYLINVIRSPTKQSKISMLPIISFLLVLLCIFRVVFMFGYPNGLFDGNELAEFVVFEIPTFLLFSVVITSIFFWKKLSGSKKFFVSDSNKLRGLIFVGLIIVWSIWVIVTIVYSEVILEEDGESQCPGRVAPSYDKQEEDTRTLTIAYQSILIFITFLLGAIFCYYSYNLIQMSKNVSKSKRFVMVIGGVIVVSFFVRCILFIIILAADFVSSVYMFITLMITEVFLLFFLQLQFNFALFLSVWGGSSTQRRSSTRGTNREASSGSRQMTHHQSSPPHGDTDD